MGPLRSVGGQECALKIRARERQAWNIWFQHVAESKLSLVSPEELHHTNIMQLALRDTKQLVHPLYTIPLSGE